MNFHFIIPFSNILCIVYFTDYGEANYTVLNLDGIDIQFNDTNQFLTDARNTHQKREGVKQLKWTFPVKWHRLTCQHKESREYRWKNEYQNPKSDNLTITVAVKNFKGLTHDIDVKKIFNGVMLDHCICYGPKNHALESFCSCNMFCICMKDMSEYLGCHSKISFKAEYQFIDCSSWHRSSEVSCRKYATKVTRCGYANHFVVG